jgi:hypothetical protein
MRHPSFAGIRRTKFNASILGSFQPLYRALAVDLLGKPQIDLYCASTRDLRGIVEIIAVKVMDPGAFSDLFPQPCLEARSLTHYCSSGMRFVHFL